MIKYNLTIKLQTKQFKIILKKHDSPYLIMIISRIESLSIFYK